MKEAAKSLPTRSLLSTAAAKPALVAVTMFATGVLIAHANWHVLAAPDSRVDLSLLERRALVGIALLVCSVSAAIIFRARSVPSLVCVCVAFVSLGALLTLELGLNVAANPLAHVAATKPLIAIDARMESDSILANEPSIVRVLHATVGETHLACDAYLAVRFPYRLRNGEERVGYGDRLTIEGTLEPLADARNPYEAPSDERLLDREGVAAKLHVAVPDDVHVVKRAQQSWWQPAVLLSAIRGWASSKLDEAIVDSASRALVKAAVFGERSGQSSALYSDFVDSGLSHLFVVSGFNVAVVALLIEMLMRLMRIGNRPLRILAVMIGVAMYAIIAGLHPSIVRALVVVEVCYASRLLERKPDTINVIAFAALITLLLHPLELFAAGFQYSYAIAFGLAAMYPLGSTALGINRITSPSLNRLAQGVLASAVITLSALPVVVWHFHRIAFAGAMLNVGAFPVASVITMIGVMLPIVQTVSSWVGGIYGEAVGMMAKLLIAISRVPASVPHTSIAVGRPSIEVLLVTIGAFVYTIRASTRPVIFLRAITGAIGIASALVVFPNSQPVLADSHELRIAAFDIGQGDCIAIHSPAGHTYFIDAGGRTSPQNVEAKLAVLPMLEAERSGPIDALFLTHMHLDHYGGASLFAARPGVRTMYWSGERVADAEAIELDRAIHTNSTTIERIAAGDRIALEPELTLYVLHPPTLLVDRFGPSRGARLNNGSLAVKLVYKHASALFLGDIEQSDEQLMLGEYGPMLKSDVVKVAHHGSAGSVLPEFVSVVSPSIALISVGEYNRYGHPAKFALNAWARAGAKIHRTDREGAIVLSSDGETFRQIRWR